jgi:A1 cistron-splicing factor AAR2
MVGPKITRIMEDAGPVDDNSDNSNNSNSNMDIGMSDYDDDDDDGPVVVSSEEIEASFARSSSSFVTPITTTTDTMELLVLRKEYPLLAAAIMPNEDVLMTCARALDEKRDVSLVREAAEYLQQVEQYHLK